jgi:hypothetical protein
LSMQHVSIQKWSRPSRLARDAQKRILSYPVLLFLLFSSDRRRLLLDPRPRYERVSRRTGSHRHRSCPLSRQTAERARQDTTRPASAHHGPGVLYQRNMEMIASESSALFDLSMQHVSIQKWSRPSRLARDAQKRIFYTHGGKLAWTKDMIGDDGIPSYVILSHTWDEGQEVTFDDPMRTAESVLCPGKLATMCVV